MQDICETGPTVYSPYPRRIESLTIIKDVIIKEALSPQLFKDPECWSGRSRTHDLPHGSPVLNQLSHRCAVLHVLNERKELMNKLNITL